MASSKETISFSDAVREPRFKDIFVFVRKKDLLICSVTCFSTVVTASIPPVMSVLLGRVFDIFAEFTSGSIEPTQLSNQLRVYIYAFVGLSAAAFVFNWAFLTCWVALGEIVSERARKQVIISMMSRPLSWYDTQEEGIGGINTRIRQQIDDLQLSNAQPLGYILESVLTCLFSLGVAFSKSWSLTLVILASLPLVVVLAALTSRRCQRYIREEKKHLSEASSIADRATAAISTVMAFNGQKYELSAFAGFLNSAGLAYRRLAHVMAIQFGGIRFIVLSMFVQGFWYGGYLVRKGSISAGDVLTVFWSCLTAAQSLSTISPQVVLIEKGRAAGMVLSEYLAETTNKRRSWSLRGGFFPTHCLGEIEFRDVNFSYPSRPDQNVLSNVSLFFPSREITFVCGESGSGKSTLGALLLHLYDLHSGTIFIDGRPTQTVASEWIRSNVTLVQQESVLFDGSIEDNLRKGSSDPKNVSEYALQEACQISLLHSTINELPDGLATSVGRGGSSLSGGQRQRIAIARAYIRDTPILLLDEATSALDSISRSLVLDAIRAWRHNKTTIIITHDLTQIGEYDFAYILRNGRILLSGFKYDLKLDRLFTSDKNSQDEASANDAQRANVELTPSSYLLKFDSQRTSYFDAVSHLDVDRSDAYLNESIRLGHGFPSQESLSQTVSFENGGTKGGTDSDYIELAGLAAISKRQAIVGRGAVDGVHEQRESLAFKRSNISSAERALPLHKILRTLWPTLNVKTLTVSGLAICVMNGAATPAFSFVLSKLFAIYFTGFPSSPETAKWACLLLAIAIGDGMTTYLKFFVLEYCAQRWIDDLRLKIFSQVLGEEKAFFDIPQHSASNLTRIILNDCEDMRTLLGKFIGNVTVALSMILIGVAAAFAVGWQFTLVACSIAPAMYAANALYTFLCSRYERFYKISKDQTSAVCYEDCRQFVPCYWKLIFLTIITPSLTGLKSGVCTKLFSAVLALMFWYGGLLVQRASYTVDNMIAVFSLMVFSLANASSVINLVPQMAKSKQSSVEVLRLFTETKRLPKDTEGFRFPVAGQLIFDNVSFTYAARPDAAVLNNFSLEIRAREYVMLVGESGCGKSTVASLLQCLYSPVSGRVLIDGHDMVETDIQWLRSNIGVVSQDNVLFRGSISENITYGMERENCDESTIVESATNAGIHDFITSLPEGYGTVLGSNRVNLSGGQVQRLAFARAIIRKPSILILDECTSALDPDSRSRILGFIDAQCKGKITLVAITHDQEMMKACDRIVVLDGGQVVEEGKYDKLVNCNGPLNSIINQGQWIR